MRTARPVSAPRSRLRGSALSEINVTPFVDVMLVLLIIFMVTAPLMQQGMDINLPQAKGKALTQEERINIVMKKNGSLYLDEALLTPEQLIARLKDKSRLNPDVFLRADKDVAYGDVVRLMGEIKDAGIEKLGIVTEPPQEK
jgi:biopolymer transport protein TolR